MTDHLTQSERLIDKASSLVEDIEDRATAEALDLLIAAVIALTNGVRARDLRSTRPLPPERAVPLPNPVVPDEGGWVIVDGTDRLPKLCRLLGHGWKATPLHGGWVRTLCRRCRDLEIPAPSSLQGPSA